MIRLLIDKTNFFFLAALATAGSVAHAASAIPIQDLRPGDVILIDLGCYMCRAINITTGSPFNHSGLVIETEASPDGPLVAQSLTGTEAIPLRQFLRQAKGKTSVAIRRPLELSQLFEKDPLVLDQKIQRLKERFAESMRGRPFDDAFLWDNRADDGGELLYCSEMIQKTLDAALTHPLNPAPMDFTPMWDYWESYFGGQVPQGEPGNSPATFANSPDFETVWTGLVPDQF